MSIINEIKCARCDRKYSGVRSRCPYCGARRIGRGKYTEDSDNAKGKMLISILIMAVFTVAAGILLFTTPVDADAQTPVDDPSIASPEDDIEQLPGLLPEPPPVYEEPEPEEPVIIQPEISSLVITYSGSPLRDNEFTMSVSDNPIPLNIRIEPPGAESGLDITWWSENAEVADVVEAPGMGGLGANVTSIGTGNTRIFVSVGDQETSCLVRVNR